MTHLIVDQINNHPSGWIFSASNFSDLAQRNTIDQTLLRLSKAGRIQKISTGLFCVPMDHPILGSVTPSIDDVVQAYAQKFSYHIQVSPSKAANILGLSQQVVSKHIYLTDGPSRSLVLSGVPVILKHVCPRKLIGLGTKAGLIIQALYGFGAKGVDKAVMAKIKNILDADDQCKKDLRNLFSLLPHWMQKCLMDNV